LGGVGYLNMLILGGVGYGAGSNPLAGLMPPEPERKGEHSYKGCRFLGSSITRETRGSSQGGSGDLVLSQGC